MNSEPAKIDNRTHNMKRLLLWKIAYTEELLTMLENPNTTSALAIYKLRDTIARCHSMLRTDLKGDKTP